MTLLSIPYESKSTDFITIIPVKPVTSGFVDNPQEEAEKGENDDAACYWHTLDKTNIPKMVTESSSTDKMASTAEITVIEQRLDDRIPTLKYLSLRASAMGIFKANTSAHKVRNGPRFMRDFMRYIPVPRSMKEVIADGLTRTFKEVQRWWDKHAEIFPEKRKARKSGHLTLYFDNLVWKSTELMIDDRATAVQIIADNADWHQLQFQFGCAYALEDVLTGFDRIRLRVFKERLGDHPLYNFWAVFLEQKDKNKVELIYNTDGLAPYQPVSLAFQWALQFGYTELTHYLWDRVTEAQREYIGMLQWRKMCMSAKSRPTFKFLCTELCRLNPAAARQISWQVFYHALSRIITEPDAPRAVREVSMCRIKFLLYHACPTLRTGLLSHQNYRAIQLALQYKEVHLFGLLQCFMTDEQLREARRNFENGESVKQKDLKPVRVAMANRQWSIA